MSEQLEEGTVPVAISEEATPILKETVAPKDERAEMAEFLGNEENRQKALELASQIEEICGSKWFTLDKFVKKSRETRQTAFQKLKLCELFHLAIIRIGDARDDRKDMREPMFKITISIKDKVEGIDRIITYHQDQIEKFTSTRNSLLALKKEEAEKEEEAKNKQ